LSSIEKQLNGLTPGSDLAHLEFFPSASLITRGKFKQYQKKKKENISDVKSQNTSISIFSNFSSLSFSRNGVNSLDKYIVSLENVSKITDIPFSIVKSIFRLIIDNLLKLKDHYNFNLDLKVGNLFIGKESIEFRPLENYHPKS